MKSASLIILIFNALATQICLGQQLESVPAMAESVADAPARPDPIEWIQYNWKAALRTVTLTGAVEVPLIIDGENIMDRRNIRPLRMARSMILREAERCES